MSALPGLRPQSCLVAVISSLAALQVFNEIYILTGGLGGILNSGVTMVFYLWRKAFRLQACRDGLGDRDGAAASSP